MQVLNFGAALHGRVPPRDVDASRKGIVKRDVGDDGDDGEVDGRGHCPIRHEIAVRFLNDNNHEGAAGHGSEEREQPIPWESSEEGCAPRSRRWGGLRIVRGGNAAVSHLACILAAHRRGRFKSRTKLEVKPKAGVDGVTGLLKVVLRR